MAYAPPPGTTNSLPARPPASSNSKQGFRPAFASAQPFQAPGTYPPGSANYSGAAASNYASPSNYPPRSHYGASAQYGSAAAYSSSSYPGYTASAPGVNSATPGYGYGSQQQPQHAQLPSQQQQPPQQPPQQPGYGSQNVSGYATSSYAPPQIQNPFPAPGTAASTFDPSEAAQIAEWQSTYNGIPQISRDGKPLGLVSEPAKPDSPAVTANPDKKKTVVRQGGGKKWTDDTLLEWDPSHLRLFVGNLAGETTDESLLKAFSRWKSVQKARVIRDKRTTKSKGYGFVSFSNPDDFFQAAKEMNGKYIQSHPVVVRKANTEIKVSSVKDKTKGGGGGGGGGGKNAGGKNNNKNKKNNGSGGGGGSVVAGYEPSLGPVTGAGVTKPGQKTKNGLRLLG